MPDSMHQGSLHESELPPPAPSPRWARWIAVAAAVVLVLGPLLGGGLRHEPARWRVAAGLEKWLDGDLSGALAEVDAAANLAPDYPGALLLRAELRIESGDYAGALEDAQEAAKLGPLEIQGVQQLADALLHLGRADEAAQTWIEFADLDEKQYRRYSPNLLNSVAYYRALGGVDLNAALKEINVAIAETIDNQNVWKQAQAAFLDTRGYIHYQRGDLHDALEDLNSAVFAAERDRDEVRTLFDHQIAQSVLDPRRADQMASDVDRSVAVIRYHRALTLKSLDQHEAAERDYRRVRELGFQPSPHLF